MGVRVSTGYGIDAGDGFTAVVRAVRAARGVSFSTIYVRTASSDATALQAAAGEVAMAAAQRTAVTVAAMPARDSVIRRIDVPLPSLARARRVLPSMLDVQLPFRLEDCSAAYPEVRRGTDGRIRALAVASPREAVESRLATLREAGFDPMILDAEALALWARATAEHPPTAGMRRVVAHAAPDRFVLAVGSGADLESVITQREALRAPGTGGGGAWAAALQRARQAVGGSGPMEWIWTGPEASADSAVLDAFERDLGAGAAVTWIRVASAETFLARALAARALSGGPLECNLRTGDLAHSGLTAWGMAAGRRAAMACMAAGLALAGLSVAMVGWADRRADDAQQRVQTAALRVGRLVRVQRGQELRMVRDAVEKRLAAMAPLPRMFQPSSTWRLAGLLKLASSSQLTLEVVELSDKAVRVQGTSPNRDACGRVDDFLRLEGYRTEMRRSEESAEGRVPFTIQGERT